MKKIVKLMVMLPFAFITQKTFSQTPAPNSVTVINATQCQVIQNDDGSSTYTDQGKAVTVFGLDFASCKDGSCKVQASTKILIGRSKTVPLTYDPPSNVKNSISISVTPDAYNCEAGCASLGGLKSDSKGPYIVISRDNKIDFLDDNSEINKVNNPCYDIVH